MEAMGTGFLMGFLGGAHCIGMCGVFALLAGSGSTDPRTRAGRLAAYFLGKTITYATLGAVLGVIGHSVPGSLEGVQVIIAALTGIFLTLIGWHMTGHGPSWALVAPRPASAFVARMGAQVNQSSAWGRFLLGLLNGLLPCGLVYAALASSFLLNNAVSGALFMTAFGVGTIPALAVMGVGTALFGRTSREQIVRFMGWVVIILGLYTLFRVSPLKALVMGGM